MITKETALKVYNCYQQLGEIEKLQNDMREEINEAREKAKNKTQPLLEKHFTRHGKGLQLGFPDEYDDSMRVFNISPELGLSVMDEQKAKLQNDMRELEAICKLELN